MAATATLVSEAPTIHVRPVIPGKHQNARDRDMLLMLDTNIAEMSETQKMGFCDQLIKCLTRGVPEADQKFEILVSLAVVTAELLRNTACILERQPDYELEAIALPRQWASLLSLVERQSRDHYRLPVLHQVSAAAWLREALETNSEVLNDIAPALKEIFEWSNNLAAAA